MAEHSAVSRYAPSRPGSPRRPRAAVVVRDGDRRRAVRLRLPGCVAVVPVSRLETFSAGQESSEERIQYWNDVSGAATTPLAVDPTDNANFRARLDFADLGTVKISDIWSTASTVRHSSRHVARSREQQLLLALQLEGRCKFRQVGREAMLSNGDFAIFDNLSPFEVRANETHRLLIVAFSRSALARYVPDPGSIIARHMPGDTEFSGLVSGFIQRFWSSYRDGLGAVPTQPVAAAVLNYQFERATVA